jgi:hypothetical protein
MTRATIAGAAAAIGLAALALLALTTGRRGLEGDADPAAAPPPPVTMTPATGLPPATAEAAAEAQQGFLYGRVTTAGGVTYQGRLRFGGSEEAFWGDYFNGFKDENPWAAHAPPERLKELHPIEVFGIVIARRERQIDLGRPFLARFGDLARIEHRGRDLRVTLKSGTVLDLDRFAADDFADGVRVWDDRRGVVDFAEHQIRAIELLPTARLGAAPTRLYGTVRTRQGDFTGFIQWGREGYTGDDELAGRTAGGALRLRFDTLRSIARRSRDSALVTLDDGREVVLSGTRGASHGSREVYVGDRRYGRVRISWDAFERADFSPGGSGPAYGDFPLGRPLTGRVTTRNGRRLAGRLVFDLDESETVETLDAPSRGVDYTLPFGRVASIAPSGGGEGGARRATVTLHGGEELELEAAGDLGEGNAGLLVFVDGRESPEYVPWADVAHIGFDPPPGWESSVTGIEALP